MNTALAGEPSRARFREVLDRSVHDLRNPLSVVRASLEWLEVELAGREDALDAVRDATTATTRILSILEDLDMLARLESGDGAARGVVDIGAAIGRVASAVHERLEARGVAVVALATAPMHVPGDVRLIDRALEALVSACARAAPSSACVEIDARIVGAESGNGVVEIAIGLRGTVAPEGRGKSIEALESGGIGVYLALRVIEEHSGSLVVHPTKTGPITLVRLPLG